MNDKQYAKDFEKLEPTLQSAVNASLADAIPEDAILRVKSRAKQLADPAGLSQDSIPHTRHGKTLQRWLAGLASAAALLAVVIAAFSLLNHSGNQAFAQMIEKVKAASSVHFTTFVRFHKQPEYNGVVYLEGNRMRIEEFDGRAIQIADLDRKQALMLDMPHKKAQAFVPDAAFVKGFNNPVEQLQHIKLNEAELIGEEILRERRAKVYRIRKARLFDIRGIKGAEMTVWVDMESELPAKILIRDPSPTAEVELRFDDFVWNERLDAKLFALDMPEGFQKGILMPPVPDEKSLQAKAPPDNPNYPADGILSTDLVPGYIVWSPDGKTITALMRDLESRQGAGSRPYELRQWDVTTGKLRWSDRKHSPRQITLSPDGKTLATVYNWQLELRDAATGKITRKWATEEFLSWMDFSPDGKTLAAGIAEWGKYGGRGGKEWGGVQLWDIERAALVRTISDDKPLQFLRFSIDGKFLVTSAGQSVKLWNVETGKLARIFPGTFRVDFSPDGKTIACPEVVSSKEENVGKVGLYNLNDGLLVKMFTAEKGPERSWLTSIAFSPDGRLLAASDWNKLVTVWDVATGQRKLTITDHKAGVLTAVFSPDGTMLATGSEDQTLCIHKLPAELIQPSTPH
jgi:WD40 repeat protein/outer membrane lipoprotein-sorting protein